MWVGVFSNAPKTLCEHAKGMKDVQMAKVIPRVKQDLESILYRISEVLKANDLAPTIGVRIHKDIDGMEGIIYGILKSTSYTI